MAPRPLPPVKPVLTFRPLTAAVQAEIDRLFWRGFDK